MHHHLKKSIDLDLNHLFRRFCISPQGSAASTETFQLGYEPSGEISANFTAASIKGTFKSSKLLAMREIVNLQSSS
jgi:hypothetical protein